MEVINVKKNKAKVTKSGKTLKYLAYIIVFLIIVLIAYSIISAFLSYSSIQYITQPTKIVLSSSPALILLNGNEYAIQLLSYSNYTSEGTFAINKFPIFINPTMFVKIPLYNFTDVNLSSKYADLRISLENINGKEALLGLTPIPINLTEIPTVLRISFMNNTLSTASNQATGLNKATNTNATTQTTNTTKNATSPSPSKPSPTSNQTAKTNSSSLLSIAKSILKTSAYYPVMLNYTTMYGDEVNCTPSKYNSTYFESVGSAPSGMDTYANISALVPYKLTLNITNSTPQIYTAVYKTYSRNSSTTGNAITIKMNVSNNSIISTTLEGAYYGMNYTQLNSGYLKANRNGVCGVFMCSTSKGC